MKTLKYNYYKVIQQNYGQGFEDASQYKTNSSFKPIEKSNKINKYGIKLYLLSQELKEHKLLGYPTRVIKRKLLNNS